ncbi:hypothetical protein NP233_g2559 [Leucocoprinus birnbaumii]|uniref:Uncharacterized protein n=1 Tax=Leucocoprinus birnbaumii TaxID=56174 RepID=A0AAD5VY26_9AGAR|nr:hypothetical protein NP233_g2559 [Leucocoprinus birnbaumii]
MFNAKHITTLASNIAEHICLLDAIHSKLNYTQSKSLALCQETAAIKKVLLNSCGAAGIFSLSLPPPAPLPVSLGTIIAATAVSSPSLTPVTAEGVLPSPPGTPAPTTGGITTASTTLPIFAPTLSHPPPLHSLRKVSPHHLH